MSKRYWVFRGDKFLGAIEINAATARRLRRMNYRLRPAGPVRQERNVNHG